MDKKIDLSILLSTCGGSAGGYTGTVNCRTTSGSRDADQKSCDVDI